MLVLFIQFKDDSTIFRVNGFLDGKAFAVLIDKAAVAGFFAADIDGIAGNVPTISPFRA